MKRKILIIIATIFMFFVIGVAIPKLTVHDLVSADVKISNGASRAAYQDYDNPFERLALYLGKSRITAYTPFCAEIESFTLFRIPLGVLRGQPQSKMMMCFNILEDYSTSIKN